ncbi:hypothetical protein J6590_054838 [Homalodisca vitripennis]|nr:hypothetical protein J6590_054838 [Homalodisca vitripennis]
MSYYNVRGNPVNNSLLSLFQWKSRWCVVRKLSPVAEIVGSSTGKYGKHGILTVTDLSVESIDEKVGSSTRKYGKHGILTVTDLSVESIDEKVGSSTSKGTTLCIITSNNRLSCVSSDVRLYQSIERWSRGPLGSFCTQGHKLSNLIGRVEAEQTLLSALSLSRQADFSSACLKAIKFAFPFDYLPVSLSLTLNFLFINLSLKGGFHCNIHLGGHDSTITTVTMRYDMMYYPLGCASWNITHNNTIPHVCITKSYCRVYRAGDVIQPELRVTRVGLSCHSISEPDWLHGDRINYSYLLCHNYLTQSINFAVFILF